jgi:hypothetical protein
MVKRPKCLLSRLVKVKTRGRWHPNTDLVSALLEDVAGLAA